MNCFQSRRALLAEPRRASGDLQAHLAECAECSGVALRLSRLDREIEEAAALPAPDALAQRIIRAQRRPQPLMGYAAAAAVVIAVAVGIGMDADLLDALSGTTPVKVVGPTHPAVAAIAEVKEDAARITVSEADAARELDVVLKRLGLTIKQGDVATEYIGKCSVTGTACDRIVLSTPDAQANVMLVPDYPLDERVLVSDRHLSALISPARGGGYIVVADTPKTARRMAKLLVKG